MSYKDLRAFIALLEEQGELKRIKYPVDPQFEMTEISDRTLRQGGPALLFENPKGYNIPVLCNLFGTEKRVAMGMGANDTSTLREIGELLAFLRQPEPPQGFKDAWSKLPIFKKVLSMSPKLIKQAPCQEVILTGDEIDLSQIPIQTCWPNDAGPLVTWPLVITQGPHKKKTEFRYLSPTIN